MIAQLSLPFDPPAPPVEARSCWMDECPCSGRGGPEHEECFWIRWYMKHLHHGSGEKYLANVRNWIHAARHGWGGTFA